MNEPDARVNSRTVSYSTDRMLGGPAKIYLLLAGMASVAAR
jgi:hypothetical protein